MPDDDLIRCIETKNNAPLIVWDKHLFWLMRQFKQAVMNHKQNLPTKAKRFDQPHFLWIQAPLNVDFSNNEDRVEFNKVLESVGKQFNSTSVLPLRQIWDPDCSSYFIGNAKRYTSEGLHKYWEAIDRTIKYCDVAKLKNNGSGTGRWTAVHHLNSEKAKSQEMTYFNQFEPKRFNTNRRQTRLPPPARKQLRYDN